MTVGMWDDVRQLREKLRLYDFEMAEVNSENERLLELVNVLKQELRRSEVATEMSELVSKWLRFVHSCTVLLWICLAGNVCISGRPREADDVSP
eukprot:GHVN01000660.1.p1 GENE.GHVN01000660.1~~GHVN01000660.1.p1  ORF type:complete len:105 (+),score=20.39 GHVN01000660.1:35-316(+)